MRKREKSLQSVISRYVLLLALLFLLILIVYSVLYSEKVRRDYLQNNEANLENEAARFQSDVSSMQKTIDSVFAENLYFSRLLHATSDFDWFTALYHLRNSLSARTESIDYAGGLFYYEYGRDSLCTLISSLPYAGDDYHFRETLRALLRSEDFAAQAQAFFSYEGETYYTEFYRLKGHFLGFTVNISRYFTLMEAESYLFVTADGEIAARAGDAELSGEEFTEAVETEKSLVMGDYAVSQTVISVPEGRLMRLSRPEWLFEFWKWPGFIVFLLLIFTIGAVFSVVMYRSFRRLLLHPVRYILQHLNRMKEENAENEPESVSVSEFASINREIDDILNQMSQLEREKYEEKSRADSALLQYYRLQVNPHFFINALNNVDSLLDSGSRAAAHELIRSLSRHFRYVFRNSGQLAYLRDEMDEVRAYANIYSIKGSFPVLLSITADEEILDRKVPVLSVQTFAENSIKHAGKSGTILNLGIRASLKKTEKGNFVEISFQDNGPGYSQEILEMLNHPVTGYEFKDRNVGISNLKYRLKLKFGEDARLYFYNLPYGGAAVEMILPEVLE